MGQISVNLVSLQRQEETQCEADKALVTYHEDGYLKGFKDGLGPRFEVPGGDGDVDEADVRG